MKTQNETKHGERCTMAFGKYSPVGKCSRCDELRNGAEPRKGWYRKAIVASYLRHDCKASGCGPVCTFGDY